MATWRIETANRSNGSSPVTGRHFIELIEQNSPPMLTGTTPAPQACIEGQKIAAKSWLRVCSVLTLLLSYLAVSSTSALEYRNHADLTSDLKKLASDHPALVRLTKLALTTGNREVW